MTQSEARRVAKELGGIAVSARRSRTTNDWVIGGWPHKNDVWIVVSLDKTKVLADGD